MRSKANRAFSRRTNKNVLNVRLSSVLSGIGAAVILGAGFEVVQEIVLRLEPGLLSLPLTRARCLTGIGALLGCTGFVGCQFVEGRSCMARSPRYLYASAFAISVFALLIEWFGVSGASDWQS